MEWTENDEINNTGRSSTSSTISNQENLITGSTLGRRSDLTGFNATMSSISAMKSNSSTLTPNNNNKNNMSSANNNNNNSPELQQSSHNDSLSDEELSDFSISFSDDEEFRINNTYGNNNGNGRIVAYFYNSICRNLLKPVVE